MPTLKLDFVDYHRTIIGYHGTSEEHAERLVAGEPFEKSCRDNEWLGEGVYFWEHAPKQAWRWAKKIRKFKRPAVVGAMIRLGNCFDLLDPDNVTILKEFYAVVLAKFAASGQPPPVNHRRHKKLDCAVFNMLYEVSESTNNAIDSVRAVYVPTESKKRIWKGSWINEKSHIQVCVRNTQNILGVWFAREDGRYGKPNPTTETDR